MPLSSTDTVFCTAPLAQRPLFDLLGPIRAAGFTAISLTASHLLEFEQRGMALAEVRTRIVDAGLKIAEVDCIALWLREQEALQAAHPYGDVLRLLTPERVIRLAEALGARSVSLAELFNVRIDVDTAAERFARICDRAGESGLFAAIEFLPAGGIPDLRIAAEIVSRAARSNGGLTVDAFHLFRSGSSLAELAAVPANQIVTVQICDAPVARHGDLATEMLTGRLLPGDGGLDVSGMVRTLRRMGVQAPMGIEVFSTAVATQAIDVTAQEWMSALESTVQRASAAQ